MLDARVLHEPLPSDEFRLLGTLNANKILAANWSLKDDGSDVVLVANKVGKEQRLDDAGPLGRVAAHEAPPTFRVLGRAREVSHRRD